MKYRIYAHTRWDPIKYQSPIYETTFSINDLATSWSESLYKADLFTFETDRQGFIIFGKEDTKNLNLQIVEIK